MNDFAISRDNIKIYFETSGLGNNAILFVHGWVGNTQWWNNQRDTFSSRYQIVQMDLAGHGKSETQRQKWSIEAYAEDIFAVAEKLQHQNIILVGHSMSGCSIVEAYKLMPSRVQMLVLVDTLQDLDHMPTMKEAAPFIEGLKSNYKATVQAGIPKFMFSNASPKNVVEQIVNEASAANPSIAVSSLLPFYMTDIRESCKDVRVPVRAINSDLYPTNAKANEKYFSNYRYEIIPGVGHYPMLEAPEQFNAALEKILQEK